MIVDTKTGKQYLKNLQGPTILLGDIFNTVRCNTPGGGSLVVPNLCFSFDEAKPQKRLSGTEGQSGRWRSSGVDSWTGCWKLPDDDWWENTQDYNPKCHQLCKVTSHGW